MIPLTAENEWLTYLNGLPYWSPPLNRTLVLSPHPDDETLGAGGLIADLCAKKVKVDVISVTDGEKAYPDIEDLACIRRKEQAEALKELGVSQTNVKRLGMTDSSIHSSEEELEQLILSLIDEHTHILAPWVGDFHTDHEVVGRIATKIADQTAAKLSYYFFWTWHRSTIEDIRHLPLAIYPLSSCTFHLKQKALGCYISQQVHPTRQPILSQTVLAPIRRPFEVYCDYKPN